MRSSLLAVLILMLSLTAASAQVVSRTPLPELTAEQIAGCREQARRFPRAECDNTRGCFSPTPEELEQAAQQCRFQLQLQLRANEAQRVFDAKRQQ